MALVGGNSVVLNLVVQQVLSALAQGADGRQHPVQTVIFGAGGDAPTPEFPNAYSAWSISLEIDGVALTSYYPGQRVQVVVNAIDAGLC